MSEPKQTVTLTDHYDESAPPNPPADATPAPSRAATAGAGSAVPEAYELQLIDDVRADLVFAESLHSNAGRFTSALADLDKLDELVRRLLTDAEVREDRIRQLEREIALKGTR